MNTATIEPMKPCSVEGCVRKHWSRGYCAPHYSWAKRGGLIPGPLCEIDGCDRPVAGRKMCSRHYQTWWYAQPGKGYLRPTKTPKPVCSVEGCERISRTKNLCNTHYARQYRTGSTGSGEIVTPAEAGSGWVDDQGYRRFVRGGRTTLEHREVMEAMVNRPLESWETVHHLNGDRLDNRPENLQLRSGRHGKGVVHRCLDCGSSNIGSGEL
jgi:hypothetical protein